MIHNKARKNVLMVVHSRLPADVRVRREAEALVSENYNVDIICLNQTDRPKKETINGVNIYRVNMLRERPSKYKYALRYINFFLRAFFIANKLSLKNKYSFVHVHNMPDFLVFVPMIQKLCSAKIILDLHDPTPEVFMAKYYDGHDSLGIKFLKFQEKISIKFADKIITTNISFLETFVSRGCPEEKITIVMNSPQNTVFKIGTIDSDNSIRSDKFIIMYHGTLIERHGLDTALEAIGILRHTIPNLEFWVFGEGDYTKTFLNKVKDLDLQDIVKYSGLVSLEQISATIPKISVGIIPNKISPFTNINFPTRIFEYLFYNKPTIVPRTRGIKDYFDENSIFFFESGNAKSLCEMILNIYSYPKDAAAIITAGVKVYHQYTWEKQRQNLLNVYNSLRKG